MARRWCLNNLTDSVAADLFAYVTFTAETILLAVNAGVGNWDDVCICRDNMESAYWAFGLATVDTDGSGGILLHLRAEVALCIEVLERYMQMSNCKRHGSSEILKSYPHFRMLTRKDWWAPAAVQAN